jgi:hypothetical protein
LAVEFPYAISRSRNSEIEQPPTYPAMHKSLLRQPPAITIDLIGKTCRVTFVLEDGCSFKSPATVSLYKATGFVTGGIQTAPENHICRHTVSSKGFPNECHDALRKPCAEGAVYSVAVDGFVGRHISDLRITSPTSGESHALLHYFFAI